MRLWDCSGVITVRPAIDHRILPRVLNRSLGVINLKQTSPDESPRTTVDSQKRGVLNNDYE
jgi:hypothetical protein